MVVLAAGSFNARQLGSRPIRPLGDEILCRRGITDAVRCRIDREHHFAEHDHDQRAGLEPPCVPEKGARENRLWEA